MAKRAKRAEFDKNAALKAVAQLMRLEDDQGLVEMAREVNARLRKPMADILRKVPGRNASDKASRCGVSRQAWYDWLRGVYRPTGEQAQRIAKLTGIPVAHIRGKGEKPRKKPVRRAPVPSRDDGVVV